MRETPSQSFFLLTDEERQRLAREAAERVNNPKPFDAPIFGLIAAVLVTILLWIVHVIHDAATVAAAAAMLLAIGTVALAFGAIGTYIEQRRANNAQEIQIAGQRLQLDLAKESSIAQVLISRQSRPGEFLEVEIFNHSDRAIRFIYVWATVRGMTGHYLAVVQDRDQATGQLLTSRRMQHIRRTIDGEIVEWCYRSLQPGISSTFDQFKLTSHEPIPDVSDDWIVAYAMFVDHEGTWWKCTEDGSVQKLPGEPPIPAEKRPPMGRGLRS